VVVLRWIDGFGTKETAAALGIPEGTVMSRLSRAMDRLAVTLKEEIGEFEGRS
jgi:DNA-directed RNA polymerase specialized sigma24 family protein